MASDMKVGRPSTEPRVVDISICILTHSQPELLPLCVASCFAEIERAQLAGEVIVVDNASADKYPQKLAETYPQIRIIRNEQNLGFSAGNNAGIRLCRGKYLLILNDDAILERNSLSLLLNAMETNSQIGAVGPMLVNPDGTLQWGFTKRKFPKARTFLFASSPFARQLHQSKIARECLTDWMDARQGGETEFVAGACMLLRRKALDEVGGFDETFHFWFEDTDLCCRIRQAAWKVLYVVDARVTHLGSASLSQINGPRQMTMFFGSYLRFLRMHTTPIKYHTLRLGLGLGFIARIPAAVLYNFFHDGLRLRKAAESALGNLAAARVLLRPSEEALGIGGQRSERPRA